MDAAVRVVVQARMGSSRLPGKILAPLGGPVVLEHVVRRLHAAGDLAGGAWEVMVATTHAPVDDRTVALCRALGVPTFRGSELDVLGRFLAATADLPDDALVVRATADNPLYCPRRTTALVNHHLHGEFDYTGIRELSSAVPEVIRVGALRHMGRIACDPYQREHVTPFFRQFPWSYRVEQLSPTWHGLRPECPLTIDTPADLARMQRLFAELHRGTKPIALEDAYAWCDRATATMNLLNAA